jgi:hypothetical protein
MLMRNAQLVRIAWVLSIGSLVSILCWLLLPSDTPWRDVLIPAIGWIVVFLLAWRLRLHHEQLWWWPFHPPGDRDDDER